MTTPTKPTEEKPAPFKKPASPFSSDPYNNRNGKKGQKTNVAGSVNKNLKSSANIAKFKGGSGGDR